MTLMQSVLVVIGLCMLIFIYFTPQRSLAHPLVDVSLHVPNIYINSTEQYSIMNIMLWLQASKLYNVTTLNMQTIHVHEHGITAICVTKDRHSHGKSWIYLHPNDVWKRCNARIREKSWFEIPGPVNIVTRPSETTIRSNVKPRSSMMQKTCLRCRRR